MRRFDLRLRKLEVQVYEVAQQERTHVMPSRNGVEFPVALMNATRGGKCPGAHAGPC